MNTVSKFLGTSNDYGGPVHIEAVADPAAVSRGAELFDNRPVTAATERFLRSPDHHLLFAYDELGRVIGMVSGVETTHPDKGTEMFLYELGVTPDARRQGVATALVRALAELARDGGCYGMWVAVEPDNWPALATYRRAAAREESPAVVFSWKLDPADREGVTFST